MANPQRERSVLSYPIMHMTHLCVFGIRGVDFKSEAIQRQLKARLLYFGLHQNTSSQTLSIFQLVSGRDLALNPGFIQVVHEQLEELIFSEPTQAFHQKVSSQVKDLGHHPLSIQQDSCHLIAANCSSDSRRAGLHIALSWNMSLLKCSFTEVPEIRYYASKVFLLCRCQCQPHLTASPNASQPSRLK